MTGDNICSGASDNYSFSVSLASSCIGTIAIFASSAVLHVIAREKQDLRHDMPVKMAICQALLDIFSGFCMSKEPYLYGKQKMHNFSLKMKFLQKEFSSDKLGKPIFPCRYCHKRIGPLRSSN